MKLGIALITWGSITGLLCAFATGIMFITTWKDISLIVGFWTGLWLVIGGIPLYFGIKRLKHESQTQ